MMDGWTYKCGSSSPFFEQDGRHAYKSVVIDDAGNERTITSVSPQNGQWWVGCWSYYHAQFRAAHLDSRITGFSIEVFLSADTKYTIDEAISLTWNRAWWIPASGVRALNGDFKTDISLPDIPIDGPSQAFYLWARVLIDGQREPIIIPGQRVAIYEELADLVGTIHNITPSAMPGEEINVRYSIKNYGLAQEGGQTVRFYLAKTWDRYEPPKSDYPLRPEVRLKALEGEWVAKLTIPPDVPHGKYHLWMLVDADDDALECNRANNPATYLADQIRIGIVEEEPQAVQPHGKNPVVWARLKTNLFQNYPNPFNPETWIPYQLAQETPVQITIYNVRGQLVRELNLGVKPAGRYLDRRRAAYWDGRNNSGEFVASGLYWYQLQAGETRLTRSMIMVK
jgi:hypothetical protein